MNKEEIKKAKERLNKKLRDEQLLEKTASYSEIVDEIINDNKSIKTILQYIEELEEENIKLNKIIDEMALAINSYDIDEEICKNMVAPYCNNEPLKVTADVCARCVKQYFEKKVERN